MVMLVEPLDDEIRRLAALRATGVLNVEFGGPFKALVELAAKLLDVPIAYLSLLDEDRQVFKASVGMSRIEAPRSWAVCNLTLANGGTLVVENALQHPQLCSHPAVLSLGIRSYAGTVVRLPDGHVAGTVCVLDNRSRSFDASDLATLHSLAAMANELLKAQAQAVALEVQAEETRRSHEARERITRYLEQAEHVGKLGHWSIEGDGTIHFSKQTYALHGLDPGKALCIDEALALYPPTDRKKARREIHNAMEQSGEFDLEATLITASNVTRRIRAVGRGRRDEHNRSCMFGVLQDITAESHHKAELHWAASHDALTRLLNRRAFHAKGTGFIENSKSSTFVALLDLDHLKLVNDIHGHAAGDYLLQNAAERLSAMLPDALVARLGGDEFGVLLEGDEPKVQRTFLELAETLRQPRYCDFGKISPTATIGFSRIHKGEPLESAIQRADAALYHGKQHERGASIGYRPEFERSRHRRVEQIALVQNALDTSRVKTYFQPIVNLRSNEVLGAEALVRIHLSGQVIPADQFQSALTDCRVAARIFDHVLQDSIDLLTRFSELTSVSVNVAPSDLLATGFTNNVLDRLQAAEAKPERLVLEITESTLLLGERGRVHDLLQSLSEAGVGIALDDFGTGYSSLSHVSDYPITRLKIDKRFVQNVTSGKKERAITLAIIKLAHQLGLEIVAEGVENDATRAFLASVGCQMGQGFLWSPAVEDFEGCLISQGSREMHKSQVLKGSIT
jgi:diguanylate cyclase (GGDEF)-like protein